MKKTILLVLLSISFQLTAQATEGMWLPLLLSQLNEKEMQSMGMKMSAEDIYSVNQGSLKDAIVRFGGGCTGEIISDQGLLLTNHHCGYGQIQSHSSLENNYLEEGFWAASQAEELPNPGLTATFIVRMEEVTEQMLENVTEDMSDKERQSWVDKNLRAVKAAATKEDYQSVIVRPFFEGQQYFLFVTETYTDVRLVGAPPSSIGKFGADTDNWVWPRHTGDFSLFRIYAGPDGKPADYSPQNVPLQPRHYLPISLDGVAEGDFTLVFGFPGRTDEYLPSPAIEQRVEVINPIRIGLRERTLDVLNAAMQADPEVKIQYASKQSGISNAWKKWIGQSQGIEAVNGVERRRAYEASFQQRVAENPEWKPTYGGLLDAFERKYAALQPYAATRAAVGEIAGYNIELFRLANSLHGLVKRYEASGSPAIAPLMDRIASYFEGFYEDYRPEIDQRVFASLMAYYFEEVNPDHLSDFAIEEYTQSGKDSKTLAQRAFAKSQLDDPAKVQTAISAGPEAFMQLVQEDYAYFLVRSIAEASEEKALAPYNRIKDDIDSLQSVYLEAQMEVFSEKRFYPDANGTMRVTYGKVAGYEPRDAVYYQPQTYLEGVMEKYVPGDYEFDVPEKLQQLYADKDYGAYGENGSMPVCFIGTNHTTGGNSGSPAIDAHGNLVGLNFDRVWEGTMSDIFYDPSLCRNIMVDARYILFLIDKYAGASHLIEEMELVHPKKN